MVTDLKTLSPSITIDKAVDEYFLRYGYGGFPVTDDGKFLGIVTLKEVKNIPREDWGRVKASEILVPHDKRLEVPMDDDVMKALELMIKEDKGRESDDKYRQIWTAVAKRDGTEWKAQKRTKSPYGKYDPQLQVVRNKIYYVWHEDHGPTEPIWVAIESPTIR